MIIDLAPGGREGVLDRDFGVLVAPVVRRGVADHDVFMRRHCQQDVNLEVRSVPMVIARPDYGHPAGGDAMIMGFEPLEFTRNAGANGIRGLASLEGDLKWILHLDLSTGVINQPR
jgi:hypothetical protein